MHKRTRGSIRLIAIAALGWASAVRAAETQPANASMLYLKDGDYFSGQLAESTTPNVVRWQAKGAAQPFEFGVEAFRGAFFAGTGPASTPIGDYRFELSDGDLLYGSLVEFSQDQLIVDIGLLGRVQLARNEVSRVSPLNPSVFEYHGPNGLAEWTQEGKIEWREEAGRLISEHRGASLRKVIAIPEQAHFEFEISWSKSPRFTLVFSSSERKEQVNEGFRLEVWDQKLVLIRELKRDADVAVVTTLDGNVDRIHLEAFYNHSTGEFTVQALDGKQLGKVTMPKKGGNPLKCVSLINGGSKLCLEQLSVGRWNGQAPQQIDINKPRVHKLDNSVLYCDVAAFDPAAKQFVIRTDGGETRLNSSDIACVVLVAPKASHAPSARIGMHDGSRFSGELLKLEGDKLYVERPGINVPLACPVSQIRSLNSLKLATRSLPTAKERLGKWESDGILSQGYLVADAASTDAQSTCLVWKPRASATASPLRPDASGRIVYREPPKPKVETEQERIMRLRRQQPVRRGGFVGAVANVFSGDAPVPQPAKANTTGTLCLVTGDRIPCSAVEIDEAGVHFVSAVVTSREVPHTAAKALEFVPQWTAAALAEEKKLRLLTLPRMQKGSPPTHMIVSTSGDFLRGRLLTMNAITATVETRLENKQLPRDRIACVIWLHKEEEGALAKSEATSPPANMSVQAIQSDGIRLTFSPHTFRDSTLSGVSDSLGECNVQVGNIDQLVFGSLVQKVASEQIYGGWKLNDAVEPLYVNDGADGTNPGRAESSLVGKLAPDFQLDLLGGGQFKLSKQTGSVIVLDFWASWCGPCMQAMPQTEKVVEEFKDRNVKLVAVNMQEDEAAIKGALDRLKIAPTVAMDIDGAIAERYQVSAIPQVVVIDPNGNVVDVMIGASADYALQLTAAIDKAFRSTDGPSNP